MSIQLLVCTCLLSVGVIALVVSRRILHPLAKYPGPWLNSLSEIPAAIAMASGRQHAYYRRLHTRYGKVVRVSPNELSYADARAWQDIYNRKTPHMEKSPIFIGAIKRLHGFTGVSMAPIATKEHSRQRKAMAVSFTMQALLQQESILLYHVRKLMSRLERFALDEQAFDVTYWFSYTTFDLMGDIAFGKPFGCLDSNGPTEWSRAIMQIFRKGAWDQAIRRVTGVDTYLEAVVKWLIVPKEAAQWHTLHMHNSIQAVEKRIAEGEGDRKDLMHFLLREKEARQNLHPTEIRLNMTLLISAGSETTAGSLCVWTYFVRADREVYARVVKEVRERFKSPDDIASGTVRPDDIPYLISTIEETLRLVPAAATNQQRIVPPGGAMVCGEFIAEGCTVAVSPMTTTRLEENFHRATEFRPERWLKPGHPYYDASYSDDKHGAAQPFSLGPRVCIGKHLAHFELRFILTHMIWHFDYDFANAEETMKWWTQEDDIKNFKGHLTWAKPPLNLKLKKVERE